MTLVNADTGEIIAECTAEQARDITDRIKTTVGVAWELIKQAYTSRAWAALGYSSWDDYCDREFGGARLKLPREERQEVVASLRSAGLSIRAIAAATGASPDTIQKDLATVPIQHSSVEGGDIEPQQITGVNGKTYTVPPPKEDDDVDVMERLKQAIENQPQTTARRLPKPTTQTFVKAIDKLAGLAMALHSPPDDMALDAQELDALDVELTQIIRSLTNLRKQIREKQ